MGVKRRKGNFVRLETSPEDIAGMKAAQGILTARGGMTSHAAVVARGMGTCCVSGCGEIRMDEENKRFTLGEKDLWRRARKFPLMELRATFMKE